MQRRHNSLLSVHFHNHALKFPQRKQFFSTLTLPEQTISSLPSYTPNKTEPGERWWVYWLDLFLAWALPTAWLVTRCLLSWGLLGKLSFDSCHHPFCPLFNIFTSIYSRRLLFLYYCWFSSAAWLLVASMKNVTPSDRGSCAVNCKCSRIYIVWRTGMLYSCPPKDGCIGWRMLLLI